MKSPLTNLVWLTSIVSVALTYVLSWLLIPELGGDTTMWWKLSTVITCGTLAGAIIPEFVKVFTSTESRHVREVVSASREGGASLNILSGLVAGNFSAYWLGLAILALMTGAYLRQHILPGDDDAGAGGVCIRTGCLRIPRNGPVTIAVDSYGPVTDNAQSVFELSTIEQTPGIEADIKKNFGFKPQFEQAKQHLEENDGAGNTFKATAKPVLIGTAVVGATTMIFAIIMSLTEGLNVHLEQAVDFVSAVLSRTDRRRRRDLLVYRRFHSGREHGSVSCGGIHQGQHQAGRSDEGVGCRIPKRWSRSVRSMRRREWSTSSLSCSVRRWRLRSLIRFSLSAT